MAYAETEIEAIGYEPHISDVLDASPHEGLMLLKLIHYDKMINQYFILLIISKVV